MKKLLLTTSILVGLSSAAFAANPTTAQWRTRAPADEAEIAKLQADLAKLKAGEAKK